MGGFGHTVICVIQPRTGYGGDWGHPGVAPRPGIVIQTNGTRQAGPFTVQVAAAMRWLGWLIIAGTAAAGVLQGFAQDYLINTMLLPPGGYGDVFWEPLRALLPVPLLAGAALLTFARVIRLGADMDDEIKATV